MIEDGDESDEKPTCQLDVPKFKDRRELLLAADVLYWDEVFSNDRELIEEVLRYMQINTKLVVVFFGDTRQILPVIKGGRAQDIIKATLTSSLLWEEITVVHLIENKRLQYPRSPGMSDEIYNRHVSKQKQWGQALIMIGEGTIILIQTYLLIIVSFIFSFIDRHVQQRCSRCLHPNRSERNHA